MAFSGAVTLTDLNDYITPGQECIKPVETVKKSEMVTVGIRHETGSLYQISVDGTEQDLEKAKITLNDCLACSGCITSAETVLIAMQSHSEFLKVLEENKALKEKLICVSISSQARASLGAKYGNSSQEVYFFYLLIAKTWKKLCYLLKSLGVDHVFDVDFARDISLLTSANEFVNRLEQNQLPMLASACPGWICYAEK